MNLKKFIVVVLAFCAFGLKSFAAVPTEEGLLKNLNNSELPGQFITMKLMLQNLSEPEKTDYLKLIISLENPNSINMLQVLYSNAQMQNTQVKNVKFVPDLMGQIRREKSMERGLFFAALSMLTTNRPTGMEIFLEKNGATIVKNKMILNEEKMKLLRAYRSHLVNNKGRGDAGSPLNPEDPRQKEKVLELFRANTFKRAPNIELVKKDNEFMWKADWKNVQGFFSNEERRLRQLELNSPEGQIKLDVNTYVLFNGVNELPKFMNLKDQKGIQYKVQVLSLDNKLKADRKISETFEELKKAPNQEAVTYPFLF